MQKSAAALKQVAEEWRARPVTRSVAQDLKRYGAGVDVRDCANLHALVNDLAKAQAFTLSLIQTILPALRAHALGEAPFRFKNSQGLATLQLMESGGATVSLAAYEPLASEETPSSALFSDREVHEIALGGEALVAQHRFGAGGTLSSEPMPWFAGHTSAQAAQTEARQVLRVERTLLLLQLIREPERPAPTRLVDLSSGETLRIASGDKSASQAVMALSVLGALGECGALEIMEKTALNARENPDVRWEAARQCLALDAARGLALLVKLAGYAADPLAKPAASLKTQLLSAQPELRALIREQVG